MAVRLNILVLRPSGGGTSWHDQCDDLLGHLLGLPGLDVTLLERLPRPGDGSTETLALESIGGHAACLSWQEPDEVVADLARAGRPMWRRAHAGDSGGDSNGEGVTGAGPMYFFDMRQQRDARGTLAELQSLLKTLQVPTFQIAGMSPVRPAVVSPKKAAVASIPMVASPASQTTSSSVATVKAVKSSDALDRLVDELDELDI